MSLDHTTEAVVVGDAKRDIAELSRPLDETNRVRCTVKEAEIAVRVEFRVPCHASTLIEQVFDRQGAGTLSLVWDEEELTVEELARRRRRALIRAVIIVAVVVAMVATLVVPVIVRVVRTPPEPERIVAVSARMASDRMIV